MRPVASSSAAAAPSPRSLCTHAASRLLDWHLAEPSLPTADTDHVPPVTSPVRQHRPVQRSYINDFRSLAVARGVGSCVPSKSRCKTRARGVNVSSVLCGADRLHARDVTEGRLNASAPPASIFFGRHIYRLRTPLTANDPELVHRPRAGPSACFERPLIIGSV